MSSGFRKGHKFGPVCLTASQRGLTAAAGVGPLRLTDSTRRRRTTTVRVPGTGLFWRGTKR